ncbi:hypothetical protein K490DRAFT_71658 [Saccharata proteae CBS 121410]|uniref:RING-type E3 ubiquitin transferase n=1 Tax=Saccharata proteae CBS 121410 TaxID=1314787 RepID=A0A9P4M090_9PEZI|nr:hypothetical protein K490DRAFT_71658 [Saccharata proteae CBS 121410]
MRPLRLLLSLLSCVAAVTLLLYLSVPSRRHDPHSTNTHSTESNSRFRALFSFSTPSLFPPSAIISLTDDNSTFFLARPAAFGPPLPSRGLSGQLWIGSGFGDDTLGRGGFALGAEGELGCSDVPGWIEGDAKSAAALRAGATTPKSLKRPATGPLASTKVGRSAKEVEEEAYGSLSDKTTTGPNENDGTDDHLHHPIAGSWLSKSIRHSKSGSTPPEHADIQSLQESAEIAGKVVLLSRGGCGFLEKVKWAQRRGGVAVIVGDNLRGGPLVTMYARGDTSNITVPALFTSHTTAHLLSSLIPSGGFFEDISAEEAAKLGLVVGSKASKTNKLDTATRIAADRPTFTQSSTYPAKSVSGQAANAKQLEPGKLVDDVEVSVAKRGHKGWIGTILKRLGFASDGEFSAKDSRRPPSSGNIDWILAEDWEDTGSGNTAAKPTFSKSLKNMKSTSSKSSGDSFVIGVHDWRDPDLLPPSTSFVTHNQPNGQSIPSLGPSQPQGGNVVPGSGEYGDVSRGSKHKQPVNGAEYITKPKKDDGRKGWLDSLWAADDDGQARSNPTPFASASIMSSTQTFKPAMTTAETLKPYRFDDPSKHDGLWVTLTPTSMSNSPFFDTLLVLVVSPLVTLTVVYALLLLRSRIRRRRWRAPKSVVERLPIRTYHTVSSDSSSSSSPVVASAAATSRTPLLQSTSSVSTASRSRPRSRTASEVPAPQSSSTPNSRDRSESPDQEKGEAGLAAWRRKYGGRQKECVVCLEEYVDGVSRVMSLPCGHEFHAECITPWLTTRRRTCPICKGDVVRSLAGASSSASSRSLGITGLDNVQTQAAERRNASPSAARPISAASDSDSLELFEDESDPDVWTADPRVDEREPQDFDRDR